MWFFDEEMSVWVSAGKDAETQNIGDDLGGFARAVHAEVGKLIRGKALGVERAKTRFVAEERAAGHGHAAGEKSFDRRIEPDDWNTLRFQEFWRAGLGVGSATEGEHGGFAGFERAAQGGAELRGFEQAERWFAVAFEEFADFKASGVFDAIVKIDEAPRKLAGELGADGGFAGAHEASKSDDGNGGSASHKESLQVNVQEFKS